MTITAVGIIWLCAMVIGLGIWCETLSRRVRQLEGKQPERVKGLISARSK